MTARRYVTKRIVDQVASQMSERDRRVLETVARLNLVSERQLRVLRGAHSASERRLLRLDLANLVDRQVLTRLDRRVGGIRAGSDGYVYALGILGQRLARPGSHVPRTPWTPLPNHLRHALAVSQLYVDLRLAASETSKLSTFDAEPSCWRRFSGHGGARSILRPDAYVTIRLDSFEDCYFVEMDCATESTPRVIGKARTYVRYYQSGREQVRHGVFPLVVWVTPQQRRAAQITEALAKLDADHWRLFAVTTTDDAAKQLLAGTFVEQGAAR
jgi:hypothetical protein